MNLLSVLFGGLSPFLVFPHLPAESLRLSCQQRGANAFALTLANAGPRPVFYSIGLYGSNTAASRYYTCAVVQVVDNTACDTAAPYRMHSLKAGDSLACHYRLPQGLSFRYVKFKVSYHEASTGAAYHDFFSQAYTVSSPQ